MPAISVILPAFNRAPLLRSAIKSVFAQTLSDWELIVADDGSTGDAREYLASIRDPRVTVLWLRHSGNPAKVRNAALRQARGGLLAFLDSDDLWAPTKLERQRDALTADSTRKWCYVHTDCIDATGTRLDGVSQTFPGEGWIFERLLRDLRAQIAMPSIAADLELVRSIGGFDERLLFAEDLDLGLRLAMHSPVVAVSEPLCSIRIHADSYSSDRVGEYRARIELYRKFVDLLREPHLRDVCRGMLAEQSLVLAGLLGDRSDYGGVIRTLAGALPIAWHRRAWAAGAVRALVRPLVPGRALAIYRACRGPAR
jgi:glycosyltransferase involved in cell wall biosynthesis